MNAVEELKIRRMEAADLPRILAMAQSLENVPRWQPSAWLAALNPAAAPLRIALVAAGAAAGDLRGFAVAASMAPQAEIETIAVLPEARRLGVGRRLMTALAAELAQVRIEEVFLEVRVSNLGAQAFYLALGFTRTGRRSRYYIDPIEDAVLMSLNLQ